MLIQQNVCKLCACTKGCYQTVQFFQRVSFLGRCEMRSREYCDFVKGHFHPEATLCSQVTCMQDVCGMFSFAHQQSPDQIYRLWTSLFLHAGLIHLGISILIQWFFMRDMERLMGPWRLFILFFGAGRLYKCFSCVQKQICFLNINLLTHVKISTSRNSRQRLFSAYHSSSCWIWTFWRYELLGGKWDVSYIWFFFSVSLQVILVFWQPILWKLSMLGRYCGTPWWR